MSSPFIGEIRMFGGNFAPAGWAFCDGSLMLISENDTLFALIGTTYGGDGQQTFGLPDLRGRVPLHQGTTQGFGTPYTIGQSGGVESVTLTTNQLPAHSHAALAATVGDRTSPAGAVWAGSPDMAQFAAPPGAAMNASAVGNTGGSQPHENMPPFLGVNFIISLFGIFPSPN